MLARNETILKWLRYILAAALCFLIQGAALQRITLWGVIPFVYPLVAVIPATYEDPLFGTVFALVTGVVCDLLLPDMFPCLYTLVFPVAGFLAALLARSVLQAGMLCSFLASVGAFFLLDLFRCFLFWIGGKAAWGTGFSVMAREFLVTAPLILLATPLFSAVNRKVHADD